MKQPLERPMKQPLERPQEWPMKQPLEWPMKQPLDGEEESSLQRAAPALHRAWGEVFGACDLEPIRLFLGCE